eukprot:gene10594-12971_t
MLCRPVARQTQSAKAPRRQTHDIKRPRQRGKPVQGMLSITNLQVFYDHAVEAVRDVSLE